MSKMPQSDAPDASDTPDVLVLDRLSKSFGSHQAVHEVSLQVRHGEVFGFLGPNGAGKSTTIRMILDILRPTAGSVTLFGNSSRDGVAVRRRLGFLSGDMVMDNDLTGRQYLDFVAGQYSKDCRQAVAELSQTLQADIDVRMGDYSRGNRQKIGLIAALQHQPELLILDEPTSGFDPLVQEQFATLIQDFKQAGGTVFMSSHILSEVQQLCDRVAFIKDGRIVDTTTVDSLMASAAKRVVVRAPRDQIKEMRVALTKLPGVKLQVAVETYDLTFTFGGAARELLRLLARFDVEDVVIKEPELEEIFMHYYQASNQKPGVGSKVVT